MDANEVASNLKSSLTGRVRYMLTEHLRNFSNEAGIVIEQQKDLKLDEYNKLGIILRALKDIPCEMIIELIRNSSLNDDDKWLLNVYDIPMAILLTPTKTKEEIFSDELILGGKQLIQQSFSEWPRTSEDNSTLSEADKYFQV